MSVEFFAFSGIGLWNICKWKRSNATSDKLWSKENVRSDYNKIYVGCSSISCAKIFRVKIFGELRTIKREPQPQKRRYSGDDGWPLMTVRSINLSRAASTLIHRPLIWILFSKSFVSIPFPFASGIFIIYNRRGVSIMVILC